MQAANVFTRKTRCKPNLPRVSDQGLASPMPSPVSAWNKQVGARLDRVVEATYEQPTFASGQPGIIRGPLADRTPIARYARKRRRGRVESCQRRAPGQRSSESSSVLARVRCHQAGEGFSQPA